MKTSKRETSRCVLLTDSGLQRFHDARRKYRKTIENIAWDKSTPSVNTVKRAFKQGPVFVDTLERIWDYLRTCAEAQKDELADLVRGVDYVFETDPVQASTMPENAPDDLSAVNRRGWLSRQVPRPNRLFLGRRDILQHLHTALKSDPAALIPDPQALTGLGGIGKTQTAIAYVYEHRMDYDGILWLASETVEDLNEGLAGLAQELKLLDSPTASRQEALEKIHDWFQTRSGWLLVLDNADDLHALAPHFPRHHTGSLLLTTRGRNTTLWAASVEIVKFERGEGALLLLRRAGLLALRQTLDDSESSIREIAETLSDELDGLPLALDQAGAYLAETQLPIAEYAALYRTSGVELLDRYPDPLHQPVRITYQLAVRQVTRRGKYGEAAVEMLRLCAFLAPDSIPEAIFTAYPFPKEGADSPGKDPAYYGEVCAIVSGYSLIRRDPSVGTVSLHRLVQRVIRETLEVAEQRQWRERTVQAVADASPDFEFEDWSLCDQFLPHWRLCAEYIQADQINTQAAAYLLHQLGRYVRARALYTEAEAFLERSLAISQNIFGEVDRTTANYMDTLACLYRELDRTEEAEALHRRSIEISSEVVGADHAETAVKLHNLALLYIEQQEYNKAEDNLVRALSIRERELSPNHPGVATTLTQLGGVYRGQERFEEAATCYRRALEIYEKTLEPNHVDLATGCNNLALLYITTQRAAEAEPLYLRALRINETSRGPNHPETGTVLWGLAIAQWRQGRRADADPTFRRAIAVYRKHYSDDHSRLARLLRYYADFQESG
jgi:tetratricopeptide (TPR) repeat protein